MVSKALIYFQTFTRPLKLKGPGKVVFKSHGSTPTAGCAVLTAVVVGVDGLICAEKRVGEEGAMVRIHLLLRLHRVRTQRQVRARSGHRDELHQLHVWDVAEAAVVRVSPAHLTCNSRRSRRII